VPLGQVRQITDLREIPAIIPDLVSAT